MSQLKHLKEQFVSDLLGGSIIEIYNVTSIALTSYLALNLLNNSIELSLIYDFIINVVTILLSITLYNQKPELLHYIIFIPSFIIYILNFYLSRKGKKHITKNATITAEFLPKKQFLTAYRSHMLIITNLAILAVDFPIFPRRFAKVETWGTSMMDLGVGSFVFSMGLVNSRQLIKNYTSYKFKLSNYVNVIKTNTIKSIPLLVLGLIRLVSVKQLDYQEHVTEYGIHWNFFITLGCLPIILGVLDPILNVLSKSIIALTILVIYEVVLSKYKVLEFILTENNRLNNFITMNKEGVFSFIGYFTIFIFGQSFGSFVLTNYKTRNNLVTIGKTKATTKNSSWLTVSTTQGLIYSTIIYHALFYIVQNSTIFGNISRRICNLPYVLWVVSYNSTLLLGYNLIEKFIPSKQFSYILDSINNNGLIIFLIANLLTGLVNMTINTLKTEDKISLMILTGYALTWTSVAILLNKYKMYIKL
ncbi:unnamed protein product [Candida verbasci]|uniref:GPI-anchored wall transfer protein n=1 Tax=Candida verbasci TaxID=1227364 RepID=A0A9W4TRP3_9ASCO|nr:unnamed protein product [Candida verbasci]